MQKGFFNTLKILSYKLGLPNGLFLGRGPDSQMHRRQMICSAGAMQCKVISNRTCGRPNLSVSKCLWPYIQFCFRSPKWKIGAICKKITSRPPTVSKISFVSLPTCCFKPQAPSQPLWVWLMECTFETPVHIVSHSWFVPLMKEREGNTLLFMVCCHFCLVYKNLSLFGASKFMEGLFLMLGKC